jgi:hypothetical protein
VDKKYGVFTLKELYELHKQGRAIKVPTLLNERGEQTWVEVEDVVSFKKQPLKRLTLASSRLFLEISQDAIIPAYSHAIFSGNRRIILKFKFLNEIKVTQNGKNNDKLLLTTRIPLDLPEGNSEEWEVGFALGFFIAEGIFEYRKRLFNKNSLATLIWYAKKKGMTLNAYLDYMTNVAGVRLALGKKDFEKGYVNILQKHFKFATPHKHKNSNAFQLFSSDLSFIHLIKDYLDGSTSHNKHLKNEAYNRSLKFLEGILEGYLSGDGYYDVKKDLFLVNLTTNYKLYNDLIFISKVLGYDPHRNKDHFEKSPFPSYEKVYHYLQLSIFKNWHRHTAFGLVKEFLKSVEDVGEKEAFNLVLKPLYPETDRRAKFNHLFFTAYGFLVSDAVKVLDRSSLKTSLPVPVSE